MRKPPLPVTFYQQEGGDSIHEANGGPLKHLMLIGACELGFIIIIIIIIIINFTLPAQAGLWAA
jgi:hypothetical protein